MVDFSVPYLVVSLPDLLAIPLAESLVETGTGVPPCTVAELTLGGGGGVDWYVVWLWLSLSMPPMLTCR